MGRERRQKVHQRLGQERIRRIKALMVKSYVISIIEQFSSSHVSIARPKRAMMVEEEEEKKDFRSSRAKSIDGAMGRQRE
jgi:hypothetical protein